MARVLSDVKRIMRLFIGKRNENDPDSSDTLIFSYINDFINLTMTDDVKLFENYGTLRFTIDETNTTGIVEFSSIPNNPPKFSNISSDGFVTLTDPAEGSISWNKLYIYQNPGQFYQYWGVNNSDVLIPGYPTQMLYYGDQFVVRTIPNTSYDIIIYGYTINEEFAQNDGDIPLKYDYWLRYYAYGAGLLYAKDYKYEADVLGMMQAKFNHEKALILTRTHNQIKIGRCQPQF